MKTFGAGPLPGAASLRRPAGIRLKQPDEWTPVVLFEHEYIKRTVSSIDLFFEAETTQYRNDNATCGQTATLAYSRTGSTAQPASIVVTLPTVTTAQNVSNSVTTATTVVDANNRSGAKIRPDSSGTASTTIRPAR